MGQASESLPSDRDSRNFQKARIERIVRELAPDKKVEFDDGNPLIRFLIVDETSGITLTQSSGEWVPSVLADKSDDWIVQFVRTLGNGKI